MLKEYIKKYNFVESIGERSSIKLKFGWQKLTSNQASTFLNSLSPNGTIIFSTVDNLNLENNFLAILSLWANPKELDQMAKVIREQKLTPTETATLFNIGYGRTDEEMLVRTGLKRNSFETFRRWATEKLAGRFSSKIPNLPNNRYASLSLSYLSHLMPVSLATQNERLRKIMYETAPKIESLGKEEKFLIMLASLGLTNSQIARLLCYVEATIRDKIYHICQKTGLGKYHLILGYILNSIECPLSSTKESFFQQCHFYKTTSTSRN